MDRPQLAYSARTLKADVDAIPPEHRVSNEMATVFATLLRLAQEELPEHSILSSMTALDMRSPQYVGTLRVLSGQLFSVLES
jgi:hypothetical protein